MKFAHLADCHIGSWREPRLNDISIKAFIKAVDICINEEVDFILISGDLFNTALPSIDKLKETVSKLKELSDNKIPVYIVPGSHDFSPSGKTMLDVLERAGLLVNVAKADIENDKIKLKFTIDKKTGAKITGMLGKRGSLEKAYYENIDRESLENEDGYKIFMLHSAIDELKTRELENIEAQPLSLLPKNFDYYAAGHVHYVFNRKIDGYGIIAYPGPLFPNNFAELEKLETGGFYIVEDNKLRWEQIRVHNLCKIDVNCDNKTPEQVEADIYDEIKGKEFIDTIVTIRLHGTLKSGKPSDLNFKDIFSKLYEKSAYYVMKSTSMLESKEFEEIKIETSSVQEIEDNLIREHIGQIKVKDLSAAKEIEITKELIISLYDEKNEGETVRDFEKRVKENVYKILNIEKNNS